MAIIKESVIRDIIDLKDSIGDGSEELKLNTRGSIAREANAGILQFPVLTSTALSLPETTMIAKALEREYVSFVAVVTSLDSVTDAKSIESYIQRIHQNVGSTMSNMFESVQYSLPVTDKSIIQRFKESETATLNLLQHVKHDGIEDEQLTSVHPMDLTGEDETRLKCIVKNKLGCLTQAKAFRYPESTGINSVIIQERDKDRYTQIIPVMESDGSLSFVETQLANAKGVNMMNESSLELAIKRGSIKLLENYVPDYNMDILNNKTSRDHNLVVGGNKVLSEMFQVKNIHEMLQEKGTSPIDVVNADEFKPLPTANKMDRDDMVIKDVLRDNDVKKSNELIPTTMHLKTYFKTEDGSLQAVDYIIGVKAVVHPVKSESMIDNLVKGSKRGKFFVNVLKLTTGEINFFRDFVFAIDRTKDDIKTKYKDNAWWNSLIRRKKYSNFKKLMNSRNQIVPNTTIVLTMDEAEKIKAEYGIDLLKTRYVRDLISQYFLLGFVIVDSSIEVAHFMFDGQQNYQQYSFAALERENSNSAKEVKNIMQVLGKI